MTWAFRHVRVGFYYSVSPRPQQVSVHGSEPIHGWVWANARRSGRHPVLTQRFPAAPADPSLFRSMHWLAEHMSVRDYHLSGAVWAACGCGMGPLFRLHLFSQDIDRWYRYSVGG